MVNKLLRVTQMNAIYLDNELYKVLLQLFQDSCKQLPPGYLANFDGDIAIILKMVLLYNSVYKNGSTFGQQLLSIKYDNISTLKKWLYLLGSNFNFLKDRLEYWNPSHKLNQFLFKLDMLVVALNFINMSIFLRNGVKPLLVERVLGLNQVIADENAQRHFDSKYLARELLWNGFIEILVHILPLFNYHKIRRTIKNLNPFHRKPIYRIINRQVMNTYTKCAYCNESPILPHHMGCPHVFCYICLKGNQIADSKFECPVCEYRNPNMICEKVCF